jgi:hypothetical protein
MPKKGYKQSPEHLEKNRLARIGKKASEETKEKMRLAHSGEKNHNFGKKFSQETRDKISASRQGEKNPLYGTHRPEHVKKAIGDAHRGEKNKFFGKPLPEDVKEKIRSATSGEKNHNYGKPMPDYTKQKLAEQRIGQKIPHDIRVKMSCSHLGISESEWNGFAAIGNYCEKWTDPILKVRKRVRAFFGDTCVLCSKTHKDNNDHFMSVHHVMSDKSACCDGSKEDWLFVTLCHNCHSKKGYQKETEDLLKNMISGKFGGKCMLTLSEYNELYPDGSEGDKQWGKRNGY